MLDAANLDFIKKFLGQELCKTIIPILNDLTDLSGMDNPIRDIRRTDLAKLVLGVLQKHFIKVVKSNDPPENPFPHKNNLHILFAALNHIPRGNVTLLNWFMNLAHPTANAGGKELRIWLITNGISSNQIDSDSTIGPTDIASFRVGFLFGIAKSFFYDNTIGLAQSLLGLQIQAYYLIPKKNCEKLITLYEEYKKQGLQNYLALIQITTLFANDLSKLSLSPNRENTLKDKLLENYLSDVSQLFVEFCLYPIAKYKSDEFKKFHDMCKSFLSMVDKEWVEYKRVDDVIKFALDKYNSGITESVEPLYLKGEYFKAGMAYGQIVGDIAQLIVGILFFIAKGIKYLLTKLSFSSRAKLLSMLALINTSPPNFKILTSSNSSMTMALTLEKSESNQFFKAIETSDPYVTHKQFEVAKVDVINEVSASTGNRMPSFLESSVAGPSELYLVTVAGAFFLIKRRRKGSVIKLEEELDDLTATAFAKWHDFFQPNALEQFLIATETNKELLTADSFVNELIKKEKLIIPEDKSLIDQLTIFAQTSSDEFQKIVTEALKKEKNIKKYNRYGIWSSYNGHINKKLRKVALEFKQNGALILINESYGSLTKNVLNKYANIVFVTSEGKAVTSNVSKVLGMTVIEFYESFYPEKGFKKLYTTNLAEIERLDSKARLLIKQRDNQNKLLNLAYEQKMSPDGIEAIEFTISEKSEELKNRLDFLVEQEVIKETVRDGFLMKQYGKINPYSLVGKTRPDVLVIELLGDVTTCDFVHVASGAKSSVSHQFSVDFYPDVTRVLFGKSPVVSAEAPYSFFETFIKSLPE